MTVHRLDLSQLLDGTTSPGRGSGGEGAGVTWLFNTTVLETELQFRLLLQVLVLCVISNKKIIFFFFIQLVSSLCHDLKVMESFTWNDKERYIYFI